MNARIGKRPNLAVMRDDVRALEAYAVPSAVGFIKLDAMENPLHAARTAAARTG